MAMMIEYDRPDGKTVGAYLAEPAGGTGAPGIVVIQDWWGLDDQIKGVADQLAAAGYRALVPDLYRGKLALGAQEAEHLMKGLDFGDAAGQDVGGAVAYLKATGSVQVGVTGFCMGGALTVLSAVFVSGLAAAVIWYGYPPLQYVDATRIRAPLMGHWAIHDQFFVIAGVGELEQKLSAAGVHHEFFRYNAKHAFANPEADAKNLPPLAYDAVAAALAWRRSMEFFDKHLR